MPSVLLVGIAFGQAMAYWHWPLYFPPVLFQILGIVVLILTVLEGPLDLRLTRDERLLVWRSFLAAAAILMVQAAVISALLHFSAEPGVQSCLANAGALAVVCRSLAWPVSRPNRRSLLVMQARSLIAWASWYSVLHCRMISPRVLLEGKI